MTRCRCTPLELAATLAAGAAFASVLIVAWVLELAGVEVFGG